MNIIPAHRTLRHCVPNTIAVVCECGEWRSHRIEDLQRSFHHSTPAQELHRYLIVCEREPCLREFVSPDDGCAEEG